MLCVFTAERRERKTQKPGVIIIKAARALEIRAGGSFSDPRWLGDAEASWAAAPWGRQARAWGASVSPERQPCRPEWPPALTASGVSCGRMVVPGSGLRVIGCLPWVCGAPSLWPRKEAEGVRPLFSGAPEDTGLQYKYTRFMSRSW